MCCKIEEKEAQSTKADGVCWKTTCQTDSRQTQREIFFVIINVNACKNVTDSILFDSINFLAYPAMFFYYYCTTFIGGIA